MMTLAKIVTHHNYYHNYYLDFYLIVDTWECLNLYENTLYIIYLYVFQANVDRIRRSKLFVYIYQSVKIT